MPQRSRCPASGLKHDRYATCQYHLARTEWFCLLFVERRKSRTTYAPLNVWVYSTSYVLEFPDETENLLVCLIQFVYFTSILSFNFKHETEVFTPFFSCELCIAESFGNDTFCGCPNTALGNAVEKFCAGSRGKFSQ